MNTPANLTPAPPATNLHRGFVTTVGNTPVMVIAPVRATPVRTITVTCADGHVRHAEPFVSWAAAAEFAEWGHCCVSRHTFTEE